MKGAVASGFGHCQRSIRHVIAENALTLIDHRQVGRVQNKLGGQLKSDRLERLGGVLRHLGFKH